MARAHWPSRDRISRHRTNARIRHSDHQLSEGRTLVRWLDEGAAAMGGKRTEWAVDWKLAPRRGGITPRRAGYSRFGSRLCENAFWALTTGSAPGCHWRVASPPDARIAASVRCVPRIAITRFIF